jgi:hypothetical protein
MLGDKKLKKIVIVLFALYIFSMGQAFGCQTFCENCTITEINPHATGSTVVSFSSYTNDNPDGCGDVSKVIIDEADQGSDVLLSTTLSAFMANKEFVKVRTCGCKEEWGTILPKMIWTRIKP